MSQVQVYTLDRSGRLALDPRTFITDGPGRVIEIQPTASFMPSGRSTPISAFPTLPANSQSELSRVEALEDSDSNSSLARLLARASLSSTFSEMETFAKSYVASDNESTESDDNYPKLPNYTRPRSPPKKRRKPTLYPQ